MLDKFLSDNTFESVKNSIENSPPYLQAVLFSGIIIVDFLLPLKDLFLYISLFVFCVGCIVFIIEFIRVSAQNREILKSAIFRISFYTILITLVFTLILSLPLERFCGEKGCSAKLSPVREAQGYVLETVSYLEKILTQTQLIDHRLALLEERILADEKMRLSVYVEGVFSEYIQENIDSFLDEKLEYRYKFEIMPPKQKDQVDIFLYVDIKKGFSARIPYEFIRLDYTHYWLWALPVKMSEGNKDPKIIPLNSSLEERIEQDAFKQRLAERTFIEEEEGYDFLVVKTRREDSEQAKKLLIEDISESVINNISKYLDGVQRNG